MPFPNTQTNIWPHKPLMEMREDDASSRICDHYLRKGQFWNRGLKTIKAIDFDTNNPNKETI